MSLLRRAHLPRARRAATRAGQPRLDHRGAATASWYLLAIASHGQPWAGDAARLLLGAGADGRAMNTAGETPAQYVPVSARGGELHQLLVEAAGA